MFTDLRFSLYQHGELAFTNLKNSTIYGAIPKNNAKESQSCWKNNTLSSLFQDNVKF